MSESFFLTKTTIDPRRMIDVGGAAALDQHELLRTRLSASVGRAAAALFAEPLLSRGNGAAGATVSWYATSGGAVAKLAQLPADARAEAEASLRRTLSEIAGALSDPDLGPLVGAALMLDGPDDVWVVDRKPVLVNWGLASPEAQASLGARDREFGERLGRFLPLPAAPALNRDEHAARGYAASTGAAAASAGAAASVAAAAAAPVAAAAAAPGPRVATGGRTIDESGGQTVGGPGGVGGPAAPAPPPADAEPAPGVWRWRWIAPVALILLFGGLLLWLLRPGALLYPERPTVAAIDEGAVAEAARAANRALEERIARLRDALDGAVCTPRGDLVLPGGLTPDGRTPPPADAAEAPPADRPAPVRPDALAPPSPGRLVQPAPGGGDPVSLLAVLERGVAMVLAQGPEGGGHGTGFFVTPELLVTNHHVVAPAAGGGRLLVTSETLGQTRPAELIASLGPLEETGVDLALLRVPGAGGAPLTIRLSRAPLKLQQVIAAGYPGFALETDERYQALMNGDGGATPGLVVTDGIVNAEQQLGPETSVVLHTAQISPGNSGGPLVDACGRVVGVNTFIRNDQTALNSLNFALAADDVAAFLRANGAAAETTEAPCAPAVAPPPAATPPVALAPPAAAAPDAAPAPADAPRP